MAWTSEPGLFLPVTIMQKQSYHVSAPVLSKFKKKHQMSLDEAPYTGMYGFMQNNYCPAVGNLRAKFHCKSNGENGCGRHFTKGSSAISGRIDAQRQLGFMGRLI
ncbi:MAG: hypothetical protein CM1200mP30_20810 [Pseudomonadota bacterium]|nr:MAG: hypothetical protein CM1200mP30_20810 [Pseudomonadota bacterium]